MPKLSSQNQNVVQYNTVRSVNPARSLFDLSHTKLLTGDMGKLYPSLMLECVPGDVISLGNQIVVRFQPLVAPVLHEIKAFIHYFFVPYRLLWKDWVNFITRGVEGTLTPELPRWVTMTGSHGDGTWDVPTTSIGSLWDYMGFPTGIYTKVNLPELSDYPLDFPRRAYNYVFDQFYRDQTLMDEEFTEETYADYLSDDNQAILSRCWAKDYFTSALPWQQRGLAPALPIIGTSNAVWGDTAGSELFDLTLGQAKSDPQNVDVEGTVFDGKINVGGSAQGKNNWVSYMSDVLNDNTVDLSAATAFDVSDLRLVVQIQRWLERNSRTGVRYNEFLQGHFSVSPHDSTLQRPVYIGGIQTPVVISEVLQTSESNTTPQGTLAGHGMGLGSDFAGKYRVEEFGCIIGMLSVMPSAMYQQGVPRNWLRNSVYDFYFPEFAHLSEQMIETREIYFDDAQTQNLSEFGYQGRYDELRTMPNQVCGKMRTDFDYWHLSRQFGSKPELNSSFVVCNPRKDCFAAPAEDGLIIHVANQIMAYRPLPILGDPGLIDHDGGR